MNKKLLQIIVLLTIAICLALPSSSVGAFGQDSQSQVSTPIIADSGWRLEVLGLNYLNLSLTDLAAMPNMTEYAELDCGTQFVAAGNWTGVRLGYLLDEAGVDPSTVTVAFHASDNYQVFISISEAEQENVIIAYQLDNLPLQETLRLVVPGINGNVWISKITSINTLNIEVPNDVMPLHVQAPTPSPTPQPHLTPNPTNQPTPTPAVQPSPTPTPSPTPQPTLNPQSENQSPSPPSVTSSNNSQSAQQQHSSGSTLPIEYGFAAVVVIAVLGTITIFTFSKRQRSYAG